jgi:DMSO/TMAO reductase YedYZ molybdopterin-dependent catalytic subunit
MQGTSRFDHCRAGHLRRTRKGAALNRVILDPHAFFRRLPLAPHQLGDRLTRTQDTIVLCHLGVPHIAREDWSLSIDGLVAAPLTLAFSDLARFPKVEVVSVHQCAGSPLQPAEPTRRICNVKWGGVRLADILAICRPAPEAAYIWSMGADHGAFGGVVVDRYVKDLPLARVEADVLIAYAMNDEPLAPEHGFPVRLLVPGFYGTNSVKWLTRLTLAKGRAASPFTTRWYNDPVEESAAGAPDRTVPVWAIAPQSVIVEPAPETKVRASRPLDVWGWAWADGGVRAVDVCIEAPAWQPASLEPPEGRAWQRFVLSWTPGRRGAFTLASRATALNGAVQPEASRRNAIYRVPLTVV